LIHGYRIGLTLGTIGKEILPAHGTDGASLFQVVTETPKEFVRDIEATGKQGVEVFALRHAVSGGRRNRNVVAVDQNDLAEVVREDPGGEEPGHTTS
jgi:hypothetical protein